MCLGCTYRPEVFVVVNPTPFGMLLFVVHYSVLLLLLQYSKEGREPYSNLHSLNTRVQLPALC